MASRPARSVSTVRAHEGECTMVREIFYTAVRYNEDGNTQHASGVTTQREWPEVKRELARQGFHIKSWSLIEEPPMAIA